MRKIDIVNETINDAYKYMRENGVRETQIRFEYYLVVTPDVLSVLLHSPDCLGFNGGSEYYYMGTEVKIIPTPPRPPEKVTDQIGFVTKDEYNGVVEPYTAYAESRMIDGRIQTTVVEQAPRVMIDVKLNNYAEVTLVDDKGNERTEVVQDFELIKQENKEVIELDDEEQEIKDKIKDLGVI